MNSNFVFRLLHTAKFKQPAPEGKGIHHYCGVINVTTSIVRILNEKYKPDTKKGKPATYNRIALQLTDIKDEEGLAAQI